MVSIQEAMQQMTISNNLTKSCDPNQFEIFENEYRDNTGMIRCSECNEPKLCEIDLLGNKRLVRCICSCEVAKAKQEEEDKKTRKKMLDIERLQKQSLLGERYKEVRFENTQLGDNQSFTEAYKRCKRYCEVATTALEKGYGIYLYGNSGIGKTHLAACMANELMRQYNQVLFTNFFEISKAIRNTFNNHSYESETNMIERIASVDFLFIDDLGTELVKKNGEDNFMQEKIFEILNKRYNNKKPTIFTSNYSLKQLLQERGLLNKTVDRIIEMSHAVIEVKGNSYRIKKRSEEKIPF